MNSWIHHTEKNRYTRSNKSAEFVIFFDKDYKIPCWTLVFSINGNNTTVRNYGGSIFAIEELQKFTECFD